MEYYAAIDLKSFYASVECVERGLDPLTTNLVVADFTRTDGTICLAVSPSLKKLGLPGRCRLFEVKEKAKEYKFETGKDLEYIVAPPRMRKYIEYSKKIYREAYLDSVADADVFPYSIDEAFLDISSYLKYSGKSPEDFTRDILKKIHQKTGLTATAGIGTNLYLAKVAMDVLAKHAEPDRYGCRLAFLDEDKYKHELWAHEPLTDFWRIGKKTAEKFEKFNLRTMGDLARVAVKDEDFFYKLLGIDAELLIDHIWGIEPTTIKDIKKYKPETNSISVGQVLGVPVFYRLARLLVAEMADQLSLELVEKNLTTNLITLDLVYDSASSAKSSHGSNHPLNQKGDVVYSSATKVLVSRTLDLFDRIVDPACKVKRIYLGFGNALPAREAARQKKQLDLLETPKSLEEEKLELKKQESLSKAVLKIKSRYGSNSISKAMNFEEGATPSQQRNWRSSCLKSKIMKIF